MTGYTFNPTYLNIKADDQDETFTGIYNIIATPIKPMDTITTLLNSMVSIPGGSFEMGSSTVSYRWEADSTKNTTPVHTVTLESFDIGAYEVTQIQYLAVMGTNPSWFSWPACTSCENRENCPVENVTWGEAREFCQRLSDMTGRTFSLPSEAQWEYACRAGSTTTWCFGDNEDLLGDYAWYFKNLSELNGLLFEVDYTYIQVGERPMPVGLKLPNAWGLYDMHGNVWEWCLDSWHVDYTGAPTDGSAWEPESGPLRILRGGSYYGVNKINCPSVARFANSVDNPLCEDGFRIIEIK
ncbi:MAG: formylglycine-generating enzyme family protein [Syntrophaceae bacterium]